MRSIYEVAGANEKKLSFTKATHEDTECTKIRMTYTITKIKELSLRGASAPFVTTTWFFGTDFDCLCGVRHSSCAFAPFV